MCIYSIQLFEPVMVCKNYSVDGFLGSLLSIFVLLFETAYDVTCKLKEFGELVAYLVCVY